MAARTRIPVMRVYCQACGKSHFFRKDKPSDEQYAREKAAECARKDAVPAWLPKGTSETWTQFKGEIWQAKRLVLIRDSVPGTKPDNPWFRFPKCQACGKVAQRTVNDHLHGRAADVVKGIDGRFEVQHILPRKDGGADNPANLVALCRTCHVLTFRRGYRGVPRDHKTSLDAWGVT